MTQRGFDRHWSRHTDNLQVAADRQSTGDFLLDLVRPRRARDTSAVEHALATLGLEALSTRMPGELSQGQRKLVGVARALTAEPQLVCMDEPAAGLDPAESLALGQSCARWSTPASPSFSSTTT